MEYLGETDFIQVKPDTSQLRVHTAAARSEMMSALSVDTEVRQTTLPLPSTTNGYSQTVGQVTVGASMELSLFLKDMMGDAPPCDNCGNITVRNGSCYRCLSCGNSMGCS
jgi:ribonucleoside-diphosphate reductase alpha chain